MTELINEAGAVLLWRRELARGERKVWTPDKLWYAACLEARASDDAREGLIKSANEDRLRAAELMLEHFAERSEAA